MLKLYLGAAIIIMIIGAFWAGGRITHEKCMVATAQSQNTEITNSIKMQRNINEKVLNTGVRDIRDILRREYTIAE